MSSECRYLDSYGHRTAKELNELRESWLNPPEWTVAKVLEFPGPIAGPWDRYRVRQDAQDLQDSRTTTANDPVHLVNPVKNQMMIFHETLDAIGFAGRFNFTRV